MMSDDLSQEGLAERLQELAVQSDPDPPTQNRTATAMNEIKALILRNKLEPGDPLPTEATLEKELRMSRSSVREAVRKLEALDIVEVRHGSGSFVGKMSLEPMVQTLALRASLSAEEGRHFLMQVADARRTLDLGMAPAVVAANRDKKDPALDDLVKQMIEKAESGEGFMSEEAAFHGRLIRKIDNDLLAETYCSLWMVHSATLPDLVTQTKGKALPTALAHKHMLEAAYSGDLEAYQRAVEELYQPLNEALAEPESKQPSRGQSKRGGP